MLGASRHISPRAPSSLCDSKRALCADSGASAGTAALFFFSTSYFFFFHFFFAQWKLNSGYVVYASLYSAGYTLPYSQHLFLERNLCGYVCVFVPLDEGEGARCGERVTGQREIAVAQQKQKELPTMTQQWNNVHPTGRQAKQRAHRYTYIYIYSLVYIYASCGIAVYVFFLIYLTECAAGGGEPLCCTGLSHWCSPPWPHAWTKIPQKSMLNPTAGNGHELVWLHQRLNKPFNVLLPH